MQIEYIDTEKIKPYPQNSKKHSKDQIEHIINSIMKFGFNVPLVLNKDYDIICGHARLTAAKQMGLKQVPCIITELSKLDGDAFRIMDNKSTECEWDFDMLKLEIEALKDAEFDLKFTGFTEVELSELFPSENEATEDDFDVPAEPKYKVNQGDIFQLGNHRLMCGDSIKKEDIDKLMAGEKADMMFTDPPYGVNYSDKNNFLNSIDKGNHIQKDIEGDTDDRAKTAENWKQVFINCKSNLNDGSVFYITFAGDKLLLLLLLLLREIDFQERQILVWVKNNHVLGRSDYNYKHEFILYGWKKGATHKFYANFDVTTWEINKPSKNDLHPTMKPIELCAKAIRNSSNENQIVLDGYGGSGSTLIACEQLNRKCYMMEIDPNYISTILERWEKLTCKTAVKLTD